MKQIGAIVYKSYTGHTKQYAEMLGKKTGIAVFELEKAKKELPKNSSIIYMGWLMAGSIKGYKDAVKLFNVKAVCGVGMAANSAQYDDIKKANNIPDTMPLFCLQGGFEMEKLGGIYKLMMNIMKNTLGKKIAEKQDRTPDEEEMLELLINGGNRVSPENLTELNTWLAEDNV